MNRIEFMRILESKLSDVSHSERKEAIGYYNDYFNDAGVENEQEVMKSLGSPEQVAQSIKAELNGKQSGEYTENGYKQEGTHYQHPADVCYDNGKQGTNQSQRKKDRQDSSVFKIILVILICLILSPIVVPFCVGVLGAVVGIVGALMGVVIAVAVLGFALVLAGLICVVVGFVKLFINPLVGVIVLGVGLLLFGIGILFCAITIWAGVKIFPSLVRGIVHIISVPLEKMKMRRRRNE